MFQLKWLTEKEYDWVAEVKGQRHKFRCNACRVDCELGKMGEKAVKSHAKSDRHVKNVRLLKGMTSITTQLQVQKSNPSNPDSSVSEKTKDDSGDDCVMTPTASTSYDLPTRTPASLMNFVVSNDVLEAELWWTFKTIVDHQSYNSNTHISYLFEKMFPDSAIAKKFTCGEKKTSYLCVFGIAPFLRGQLIEAVTSADQPFVILFDESLNHKSQEKQMDVHVRYWSDGMVQTRYLTSQFLGKIYISLFKFQSIFSYVPLFQVTLEQKICLSTSKHLLYSRD